MSAIAKPAAWRRADAIVIHAGTNLITGDINTMKSIREIVKSIKDCSENTQVLLSRIISREDMNYNDKISEINMRMASSRQGQRLIFTDNNSIDGTCLNRGRLHWNKKGSSKFSLNLIESMKSIWLDVQLFETSSNISLRKSTYETLKCLCNENPSNVIFSF